MHVKKIVSGVFQTNTYLLFCEQSKKVVVIDPSLGSGDKVLNFIKENNLQLEAILLTHSHWDHIGDVAFIKDKTSAKVYVHKLDQGNLQKPGSDGVFLLEEIKPAVADIYLEEVSLIEFGEMKIKVIHTPGHTPGSVCFYLEKEKLLFSGDTLFFQSCGNISLPTSNSKMMWASLKKIAVLPLETKVCPGHGPSTSIGQEKWLDQAEEYFG